MPEERAVQEASGPGTVGDEHRDRVGAEQLGRERGDEVGAGALVVDAREGPHRVAAAVRRALRPRPPQLHERECLTDQDEHREREDRAST